MAAPDTSEFERVQAAAEELRRGRLALARLAEVERELVHVRHSPGRPHRRARGAARLVRGQRAGHAARGGRAATLARRPALRMELDGEARAPGQALPEGLTVSVAIPVLDGERYLEEVLAAVFAQRVDQEVEVAGDRLRLARPLPRDRPRGRSHRDRDTSGGVRARPHAQPRAGTHERRARGLPDPGLHAGGRGLAGSARGELPAGRARGRVVRPHLPRPDASPLTKRLLLDFFHDFSPSGEPVVHRRGDTTYLSNNNSCIARAAWEQIPFRDIPYAEDQALGADLLAAGWAKVYNPAAGVVHSHDYGLVEGFRRYFDEYRGLRDSVGQRTQASPAGALRHRCAARWPPTARTSAARSPRTLARARWTAQSVVHHIGPAWCSAGSASAPTSSGGRCARLLSLDRRGDGVTHRVAPSGPSAHEDALRVFARGGRAARRAVAVRRRPRVARAGLGRAPVRGRQRRAGRRSSGSCASSSRAATAARCGCTTRRGSSRTRARRCGAG